MEQCTICGQQRGEAKKRTSATAETLEFGTDLATTYNAQRFSVDQDLSEAKGALADLIDPGLAPQRAEFQALVQADRDASFAQLTQASQALDAAIPALHRMQWQRRLPFIISHLQRNHSATFTDPQPASFVPFETEIQLRSWLHPMIERDFEVATEVRGHHLTARTRVQIDYILVPRAHLVAQGFKPDPIGLEAKYLPLDNGFSPRASRFIWQAISYTDCEFELHGQLTRLSHVLLFSNLSFEDELRQLRGITDSPLANDQAKWTALLELANHANVASLQMYGSRVRSDGWKIKFASGVYFSKFEETPKLHNRRLIEKVRIGNF